MLIMPWLLMTVRDRADLTAGSIDLIRKTAGDDLGLIVVDNGSEQTTRDMLLSEFATGRIQRLLFNPPYIPQWQKCYAIRQALGLLKETGEPVEYFGWIDNDLHLNHGWLQLSLKILATRPGIEVVSLCSCDPTQEKHHPTVTTEIIDGAEVHLKRTANGAFWIMRWSFFERYGLPPIGLGITDEGTEDWYYLNILKAEKEPRFACPAWMAKHLGYDQSMKRVALRKEAE
jgi:hypothetical protein